MCERVVNVHARMRFPGEGGGGGCLREALEDGGRGRGVGRTIKRAYEAPAKFSV